MEEIIQLFQRWIACKIKIHFCETDIYYKERQIWWVTLGQNVGSEQNGKNEWFERPVLILKKFGYDTFLGVPSSSKIKSDKYHIAYMTEKGMFCVNISQIRVLSYRRLLRLTGLMENQDYERVKDAIRKYI